ncbi:MAG: TetR family transcriptional regulator [Kiritimatiellae bacterium]|nr:TetR family transcriptional regulator [Kiritimatiellia bacterium]
MARRSKEDAEKTRERILSSALQLFAKKGYEHTTFTDIAARMKMTKGAVYWHFESKQSLLIALVDEMLEKFKEQILKLLPAGEDGFGKLSFPQVADMMVRNAEQTVSDAKKRSFFLLINEQIRWSSTSMAQVRDNLLKHRRFGPWCAFHTAVENDMRAGKARNDVDAAEIASCCIALWNGLVHSHITGFLSSNLADTLRNAFGAIWRDISNLNTTKE